jgi:hypothetical protein
MVFAAVYGHSYVHYRSILPHGMLICLIMSGVHAFCTGKRKSMWWLYLTRTACCHLQEPCHALECVHQHRHIPEVQYVLVSLGPVFSFCFRVISENTQQIMSKICHICCPGFAHNDNCTCALIASCHKCVTCSCCECKGCREHDG